MIFSLFFSRLEHIVNNRPVNDIPPKSFNVLITKRRIKDRKGTDL
ncbi:hypothetical protein EcE22_2582 [Escherichia coli E22]|nr:hypothetical protein EcE22_2582 [Escherichia coli E22]KDX42560.1 hypothetical protein AD26_1378 [Escherichia coli 2-156-04_S4_C3]